MTWFWIWIAVWFLLHESVWISGSSHGSVFESSVYRVHNGYKSESDPGLLLPVQIARTSLYHCNIQPNTYVDINTCLHTSVYTHMCTPTYIHIPVYTYIRITHTHTYPHIHTHFYTHKHTLNTFTHSHAWIYIHIHKSTCIHNCAHYHAY